MAKKKSPGFSDRHKTVGVIGTSTAEVIDLVFAMYAKPAMLREISAQCARSNEQRAEDKATIRNYLPTWPDWPELPADDDENIAAQFAALKRGAVPLELKCAMEREVMEFLFSQTPNERRDVTVLRAAVAKHIGEVEGGGILNFVARCVLSGAKSIVTRPANMRAKLMGMASRDRRDKKKQAEEALALMRKRFPTSPAGDEYLGLLKKKAAEHLGISRRTLDRRLKGE